MKKMLGYVDVVERSSKKVIDTIECEGNDPERVERGIRVNLNHDEYFTKIRRVNPDA
jgi:hypothetical protein